MAKLGDVGKVVTGNTPKTSDSQNYASNDICFVKPSDIVDGTVTFLDHSEFYISEYARAKARVLPPQSVLVTCIGIIGKVAINNVECAFNQQINAIIPDESKCLTEYLAYAIQNKQAEMQDIANAPVVPILNKTQFSDIEIKLPPISEQHVIVEKLNAISKLIALRKEQLTKLDQLVKSRFIELFGDQETNPFGWTQCTVGECCTLKSGTSLSAEVENEGGPIPYVKVGDMNYPGNERYITTSSRYVSEATAGKGIFEVGSILFPKRGGAIGTNKKRMTKLPICADLNVMGVSSNGQLLPEYLLAYFDMIDLGALSDGSSVPQINNKNIAPLVICVPPMELQKQFAAFVEETDKSKLAIQQSLDKLELLKKSLMQEYFG